MGFYRIIFVALALIVSANAKGYGPGVYGGSGGFTGVSRLYPGGVPGAGARSPGSMGIGGFGGPRGGLGSYAGGPGSLPGRPGSFGRPSGGYLPAGGAGSSAYGYDSFPKPFSTGYETPDGQGGSQFRTESGDGSGAVRGTYGYFDAQGLYRVVDYVADELGFRATVRTNEPGVDGKENPADVEMIVEQTPAGIQEMYTPATAYGFGGMGASGMPGRQFAGNLGGQYGGAFGGAVGGLAQGAYLGSGGVPVGAGNYLRGASGSIRQIGGSSGLFTGIPISSTGKSSY